MQTWNLGVLHEDISVARQWKHELEADFKAMGHFVKPGEAIQVTMIAKDSTMVPNLVLASARALRTANLVSYKTQNGQSPVWIKVMEESLADSMTDAMTLEPPFLDLVMRPFRVQEILGRMETYSKLQHFEELIGLNSQLSATIERFSQDLEVATRLQKAHLPERFAPLKGLKFYSRYFAGLKPGGDHFDLAESKDQQTITLLMMNVSRHGLSSAILNVLTRSAVRLSNAETQTPKAVVEFIVSEIADALGSKDQISLFYGTFSRRDFLLKYVQCGEVGALLSTGDQEKSVRDLSELAANHRAPAIQMGHQASMQIKEHAIKLSPGDRLAILSAGFTQCAASSLNAALKQASEPKDFLNELAFQVKKALKGDDDMPERDCSALVMEIDNNALRRVT